MLLLSLSIGPTFEGRPLRYWVWDLRSSSDEQRQQAEAFFKRGGESTTIALSLMVRRREPFWQWLRDHPKSLRFLPERLLARVYDHAFERVNAITACGHMKSKSRPALEAIRASASDDNVFVRRNVAMALGTLRFEPELAIPVLITMLRDSEPVVRKSAASCDSPRNSNLWSSNQAIPSTKLTMGQP
jgi:HEAT repeats